MAEPIILDRNYCKGCQLCINVCPKGVWELSRTRNPKGYLLPAPTGADKCVGCLLCEMTCPDLAITINVTEKKADRDAA